MKHYRQFLILLAMLPFGTFLNAQNWIDVPENRFSITVKIDSAIASEPQKMYMYSMIEQQMQLHDSISFDSLHRVGTMHGYVPYEYNVNLLLQRRGPQCVPIVVNGGDSLSIRICDEDDGFNLRFIDSVEGSPSTLEMVRFQHQKDSIHQEYLNLTSLSQLYNLSDAQRDSINALAKTEEANLERFILEYACTGRSPYSVIDAASSVFYSFQRNPTLYPFSEKEVDAMMNSLLSRFPDYPPMKAFVNDSTLGDYMSAKSFEIIADLELRMYSDRFKKDEDKIVVKPLKIGDYMNLKLYNGTHGNVNELRGKYVLVDFWASWCQPCMVQMPNIRYAAQEFRDDLTVCLVGMDKSRKQWWTTIKENDMRNKDLTQTNRPYSIYNYHAYDDKKNELYPEYEQLGIETIPHNYLVDRSGRIIAKNISITLAIDKLKALLDKEKQQ